MLSTVIHFQCVQRRSTRINLLKNTTKSSSELHLVKFHCLLVERELHVKILSHSANTCMCNPAVHYKEHFLSHFGEVHHLSSPHWTFFNFRKGGNYSREGPILRRKMSSFNPRSGENTCTSQMGAACPDHCAVKLLSLRKLSHPEL